GCRPAGRRRRAGSRVGSPAALRGLSDARGVGAGDGHRRRRAPRARGRRPARAALDRCRRPAPVRSRRPAAAERQHAGRSRGREPARIEWPASYRRVRGQSNDEPMILPVHEQLRARLAALLSHQYGLAPADQPAIAVDYAPSRALGDLAVPVAFELARRLRKAPRVIAQELAAALGQVEGFARIDAAPNGYLNAFLDRRAFLLARLDPNAPAAAPSDEGKTIVEHTAINPNKAAHIGHLRNAALGDTLVRVLRFRGVPVEVQNYIDDTGVQVADVVVGFRTLERKSIDEVRALAAQPRFDYYC